jgi:hypothetical protein
LEHEDYAYALGGLKPLFQTGLFDFVSPRPQRCFNALGGERSLGALVLDQKANPCALHTGNCCKAAKKQGRKDFSSDSEGRIGVSLSHVFSFFNSSAAFKAK